jgi:photosystem II stability/assembly factor-like uncharacterized protein
MKKFLVLFVVLFTLLFSYTVVAQELGSLRKGIEISFPEKIQKLVLDPLPAGTYSVGAGGYFPTIDSAFNKLSIDGIAGEVILELIDNLYTAPTGDFGFFLNGPIPGAGLTSRVTIKPAANKNVAIQGDGYAVLYFLNTSYVTLDGIGITWATTLTIHILQNLQYSWNEGIDFVNNSDNNVIQNITFISEDYTRVGGGISFWTESGVTVGPDNNLIQNNFIKKCGIGIYVSAYFSSSRAIDNIVRENSIGTEIDSLINWGIQVEQAQNTLIEYNIIHNVRYYADDSHPGINSYFGFGDIISNNVVHNIFVSDGIRGGMGILLSGDTGEEGNNNMVYNNMVYDIHSTSTQPNSRVAGIQIWAQINPKIYYNTVYLSGTGNGANPAGSAAFNVYGGFSSCTGIDLKNNIFVNTRDESPYCASAIFDYDTSNLTTDYNNLYYEPSGNNCLVRVGSNDYLTLADWQAMGQDLSSVTEKPNFKNPYLHIDQMLPTNLEGGATPIAGIETDFDGDNRNAASPDIGADEFELDPNAASWKVQNSNFPSDITVTNFAPVNDLVCWAGGFKYGQLPYPGYIRTIDGGNTWVCDSIPGIPDGLISQVFAIDADTAYMAVYVLTSSNSKGIYKTTDGGNTWTKQNAYLTSLNGPGNIYFFDASNGVAIGDPLLETYITTNGGQTWNLVVNMPQALSGEYTWVGGSVITGHGNSVWFHTTHRMFRSTDRGYTWAASSYDPQNYFWFPSIAFQDENTGIYSRMNYNTLAHIYKKTTNGGVTWDTLSNPILDNLAPSNIIHIPGTTSTYLVAGGFTGSMRGLAVTFDAGETCSLWNTLGCAYIGFSSVESGWTTFSPTWQVYKYIGSPITTVEEEVIDILPTDYSISQNYPNPFNPSTTFRYSIPQTSKVVIKVYDILGKEIASLMNEDKSVGTYELTWNAENLPSGVYFYQLKAGDFISTKKMILLK